jgi:hypothetical protein
MNRHSGSQRARKTLIGIVAALSTATTVGCVSASKVTATANGVYVIKGRAIGPWNSDKERKKALKVATAFCLKKQSQRVLLHNIDEKSQAVWMIEHATIAFECEP